MIICIKLLDGKTIFINVEGSDTILSVKEKINDKLDSKKKRRLIFAGKLLEDYRTLDDYNIGDLSTIWSILRLRGC